MCRACGFGREVKLYRLVGLPEGLTGASVVYAKSVDEVFEKFPVLETVRSKLTIEDNRIIGFAACDG